MESNKSNDNPQSTRNPLLNINIGTYEGKIYTIYLFPKEKKIIDTFSFPCSSNALRIIYNNRNFIFASGTDEIIHMYDLKKKVSNGDLVTYSGSISDIKICKDYLIAAGDAPTLPLWRMNDFSNIINIKGHKGGINSIDVHPNGGFLVSVGRDKAMIIFDLLTGKKLMKYEFDYIPIKVSLFKKGHYALVVFDLHIYIFDLMKNSEEKNDSICQKVDFNKKIIDAYIIKQSVVVFFSDCEVKIVQLNIKTKDYVPFDENSFVSIKLDRPKKENENDLDIRLRFASVAKEEKLKLLTVAFSNDQLYLFDFNKIIKATNDITLLKKYYEFPLFQKVKLTCLNTNFITFKNK